MSVQDFTYPDDAFDFAVLQSDQGLRPYHLITENLYMLT